MRDKPGLLGKPTIIIYYNYFYFYFYFYFYNYYYYYYYLGDDPKIFIKMLFDVFRILNKP